jgi:hypothetical protein
MDLPDNLPFSPADIADYATLGRLTIGITGLKAVSNAQIDLLFPAFEQQVRSSSVSPFPTDNEDATKPGVTVKANRKNSSSAAASPSIPVVIEDEFDQLPDVKAISQIRGSLQNLLLELDNVNTLSDIELAKKRNELENYSSASEIEGFK